MLYSKEFIPRLQLGVSFVIEVRDRIRLPRVVYVLQLFDDARSLLGFEMAALKSRQRAARRATMSVVGVKRQRLEFVSRVAGRASKAR